jgi:hypothetical protein
MACHTLYFFDAGSPKQISPPGFHLVHLPFADDVREATVEELAPQPKANAEQVCVHATSAFALVPAVATSVVYH